MILTILSSTGGNTEMSAIQAAGDTAVGFMSTAFSAMTSNPYLTVFLVVTMIGAGVGLFRKLRRGT